MRLRLPSGYLDRCIRTVIHEGRVQGTDRQLSILRIDHNRDFDFASGDHHDIDPLAGENTEHSRCDACVIFHAQTDDGDLGDGLVAFGGRRAKIRWSFQELNNLIKQHGI